MARIFTFPLTLSPASLVTKTRAVADKEGLSFVGDSACGKFEGKGVVAEYRVEGKQVTVTILSKPFFAPWSMVESKIKEFFA